MSTISDILKSYKKSLNITSQRQSKLYSQRSGNVKEFYNKFLKKLIREYNFESKNFQNRLNDFLEKYFKKKNLSFLAVDGSCDKYQLEEFAIFFAASYGIRGIFDPESQPKLSYVRRDLKEDLSMVAYVPIPFAELGDTSVEEGFNDDMNFNMVNIHNKLMLLAEVYLIFKEINFKDNPDIILWDQSLSGVMHWTAPNINEIPMIKRHIKYEGKPITYWDAMISRAHPFNEDLDIPSSKRGFFNMPNRIIYELFKSKGKSCSIGELCKVFGEKKEEVISIIQDFMTKNELENEEMINYDKGKGEVNLNKAYINSWERTVSFVSNICEELFYKKNVNALMYDGKWMSLTDIDFISNVLLRRICEIAWEKRVLLIGVVKDSYSKYFIRNYLGVGRIGEIYKDYELKEIVNLLWSDRLTFESLVEYDSKINVPVSTIEYDSIFLTVFPGTKKMAQGAKPEIFTRNIPSPERLFAKSLGLFYLMRKKNLTIFNHALFIDRLLVPEFDKDKFGTLGIEAKSAEQSINIKPFFDLTNKDKNPVYDFITYFLYHTVTNKYSEVIGYPEPLHKADWGAKTFNRKMAQSMIRNSAAIMKKKKPWQMSVRSRRGSKR